MSINWNSSKERHTIEAIISHIEETQSPPKEALKSHGYSCKNLKKAGFDPEYIHKLGYNILELKNAGFNCTELMSAGFTVA